MTGTISVLNCLCLDIGLILANVVDPVWNGDSPRFPRLEAGLCFDVAFQNICKLLMKVDIFLFVTLILD